MAVTRPREQAAGLVAALSALGVRVVSAPLIQIVAPPAGGPLDVALRQLAAYDWLLATSSNTVRFLAERMAAFGVTRPANLRIGAVGRQTAAALTEHRLRPDLLPREQTAAGLLAALPDLRGLRVLLPVSDIGRDELAAGLLAQGALVDVVTAYQTVPGDGAATLVPLLRAGALDAITFASPSAVHTLLTGLLAQGLVIADVIALLSAAHPVCIGPTTATAAASAGLTVAAVAAEPSDAGLAQAVVAALVTKEDGTTKKQRNEGH